MSQHIHSLCAAEWMFWASKSGPGVVLIMVSLTFLFLFFSQCFHCSVCNCKSHFGTAMAIENRRFSKLSSYNFKINLSKARISSKKGVNHEHTLGLLNLLLDGTRFWNQHTSGKQGFNQPRVQGMFDGNIPCFLEYSLNYLSLIFSLTLKTKQIIKILSRNVYLPISLIYFQSLK